jgi:hypothetical protein
MKTPDLHYFETTMKARYVAKFLHRHTCGLAEGYLARIIREKCLKEEGVSAKIL